MSRIVTETKTLTFIPFEYDSTNSNFRTAPTNPNNGLTGTDSTTVAQFTNGRNTQYVGYYNFSITGIPSNAYNITLSCKVKASVANASYPWAIQLCKGTTVTGSSVSITYAAQTSGEIFEFDGGSWTISELSNVKLRLYPPTGANNRYLYFYGADLTVSYDINVTEYEVSIINDSDIVTTDISNSIYVKESESQTITFYNVASLDSVIITDNSNDISSSLISLGNNQYTYTISNISADHEIVIEDASTGPKYLVTATSNYSGATITPEERNVGEGKNITFTINVDNLYEITITDNGNDIKSNLTGSNGTYTYTITNVQTTHDIVINEQLSYSITASSTYSGATVSAPNKVYIGQNGTVIVNVNNLYEIIITDNGTDIKNSLVGSNGTYTYTLSNVQTTHTIAISEQLSYSITASSTYSGATVSAPSKVYIGQNGTVTVTVDNFANIKIYDDETEITSLFTGSGTTYTYTFTNVQANHTILIIEKGKINVTCVSNVDGVSLVPSGVTAVNENSSFTVAIEGTLTDDLVLTDNGVDVTSQIGEVQATLSDSKSTVLGEYTLVSGGFNSGESWFSGRTGNGHDTTNTTTSDYYSSGSGSTAVFTYKLLFDNIPSNTTITRLYVLVNAHAESTSNNNEYMCFQLRSGNNELSDELNFKTIGTSNSTQTIEATTLPTVSQLDDLVLYCRLGYYGGALNGATCYIEYDCIGTATGYTISSVTEPHDIVLSKVFIPEEEDPELVYHSLTVSSINATTDPSSGTSRIVEGTNQTITIYPSDPLLTLATDNGVDITDSLVHYGQSISDPVVSSVSGASYGFTLNDSTGYYVSDNYHVATSAALCRVTFNLPVRCLITIQYINYAEGTYDYGIFGNIDTALATSNTADSNAFRVLSSSSDNSSSEQTLTYEIESGSHFIDIKYRKDSSTNSNNDTLQWKILSVEALETNEYYEYTISNIDDDHSLVFIFGDVTYYFITSTGTSCKLFPAGSMVQLPGDNYKLTIVPDNINDEVTITDNNSNVTDELQRIETEVTKDGETTTIVNYIYNISNVQATHDIVITCQTSSALYIKIAGSFTEVRKAFIKVSGTWRAVDDSTALFESNKIYISN